MCQTYKVNKLQLNNKNGVKTNLTLNWVISFRNNYFHKNYREGFSFSFTRRKSNT